MNWQELLGQCAWAATLILSTAFAANWVLRAAPAAWRHFLWTAVLGGLLILPAMVRTMPKWRVESTAPAPIAVTVAVSAADDAPTVPAAPGWNPLLMVWLCGAMLAAIRFLAGRVRTARMVRRAISAAWLRDEIGVPVLQSADAQTAFAAGIFRPMVVLPADAETWPEERLRAALLHEWMHIRRRDLLAQAIGQAACCAYWFHPLAWLAARQLRREREQACDDAVLGRGIGAQEYAGHLVESARAMRGRQVDAMAMAEPSELERRVRALLDGGRDRRPLNRVTAAAVVAALAMVLLPVAAITVHAQAAPVRQQAESVAAVQEAPVPEVPRVERPEPPAQQAPAPAGWGSVAGVVQDPSGARIPNAAITIRSDDGSVEQQTTTDSVGSYQVNSLPAGQYTVRVTARGFKVFSRTSLQLQANQTSTVNLNLAIGNVTEAMSVTAARPASTPAPAVIAQPSSARIRVGGMVQPAMLIFRVAPVYPDDLKSQGISGTVQLAAIIDKQGNLAGIHSLGGPTGLIKPAMDAVAQWHYQPSLLNGEPVAVETVIDITFELK